jgi:EAL domain-containing protein (putative c-di-GMP-specific phosphodiesterase class I)
MFRAATQLGLAEELSRVTRAVGARDGAQLPGSMDLYLNTHPAEIGGAELIESLTHLRESHPHQPMVLEIHEASVLNSTIMKELRASLNALDIQLAYDDFGAGQTRLAELIDTTPDIVKFDIVLIRNINRAATGRKNMMTALVDMVTSMGIKPLAEGIETAEEAATCRELGFELAQGYHFGRPVPVRQCRHERIVDSVLSGGIPYETSKRSRNRIALDLTTADRVTVNDTQQWRQPNVTELIDEISTSLLGLCPEVEERCDKRIEFSDRVRVVPTDHSGAPSGPSVIATGRNLSRRGISVSSPKPFVVDDFLAVELVVPMAENPRVVTILFRVRHVNSEGSHTILGCDFVKTLQDEISRADAIDSTAECGDADLEEQTFPQTPASGGAEHTQPNSVLDVHRHC